MPHQSGFTLFELMIAISIVAILSTIAIPSYQSYVQKAALTDLLHSTLPYKNGVELCLLEDATLDKCQNGTKMIPLSRENRHIKKIEVKNSVISISGNGALDELSLTLTPTLKNTNEQIQWQVNCHSNTSSLQQACQDMMKF